MAKDKTWVDSHFVQLTAWYIELDILILTPSSKRGNPFIKIQGNISNMEASASGPPLLLGNYTNIHYQSLLPLEIDQTQQLKPMKASHANQDLARSEKTNELENDALKRDDFIYMHNGTKVKFPN